MKRFIISLCGLAIGIVLISTLFIGQPAPATAGGGLPCFLCHGNNFEGSDLAPPVAGTKLTDEQIIKQVRNPRGIMPSFSDSQLHITDAGLVSWIRSESAGRPTASLPRQQRSAALATISAVAAARATEYAKPASSANVTTPTALATPTPPAPTSTLAPATPTSAPSPVASTAVSVASSSTASSSSLSLFIIVGGVLVAMAGAVWLWQRR